MALKVVRIAGRESYNNTQQDPQEPETNWSVCGLHHAGIRDWPEARWLATGTKKYSVGFPFENVQYLERLGRASLEIIANPLHVAPTACLPRGYRNGQSSCSFHASLKMRQSPHCHDWSVGTGEGCMEVRIFTGNLWRIFIVRRFIVDVFFSWSFRIQGLCRPALLLCHGIAPSNRRGRPSSARSC